MRVREASGNKINDSDAVFGLQKSNLQISRKCDSPRTSSISHQKHDDANSLSKKTILDSKEMDENSVDFEEKENRFQCLNCHNSVTHGSHTLCENCTKTFKPNVLLEKTCLPRENSEMSNEKDIKSEPKSPTKLCKKLFKAKVVVRKLHLTPPKKCSKPKKLPEEMPKTEYKIVSRKFKCINCLFVTNKSDNMISHHLKNHYQIAQPLNDTVKDETEPLLGDVEALIEQPIEQMEE